MTGYAAQVRPTPSAIEGTDGRLWFALTSGMVSAPTAGPHDKCTHRLHRRKSHHSRARQLPLQVRRVGSRLAVCGEPPRGVLHEPRARVVHLSRDREKQRRRVKHDRCVSPFHHRSGVKSASSNASESHAICTTRCCRVFRVSYCVCAPRSPACRRRSRFICR
jgi:hypothetical protein